MKERSDASSAMGGPAWVQQSLIPPTNVQCTVRVLYSASERRARYMIEVEDPSTHELLAMRSRPFHNDVTCQAALYEAVAWATSACDELGVGDPF